jgi:hypothetical protein
MQSTSPTSAQELQSCYVKIGAYMLAEDPVAYANVYEPVYNWYLRNITGNTATNTVRSPRSAAPTTRPARQAAQPQPANAPSGRQRTRSTTPGSPGPKDAQVLAKIVGSPGGIAIEPLRRYFEHPARKMSTNILGTSLGRLMKSGLITGTPKVGPFTATEAGIEAAKKVTSINTRRRASSKATTGATAAETAQPQAAAVG